MSRPWSEEELRALRASIEEDPGFAKASGRWLATLDARDKTIAELRPPYSDEELERMMSTQSHGYAFHVDRWIATVKDRNKTIAELREALGGMLDWALANRGTKSEFVRCHTYNYGDQPPVIRDAKKLLARIDAALAGKDGDHDTK